LKIKNVDFAQLQNSLYYLNISQLKNYCDKLTLSTKGKKITLIARILYFLKTSKKIDLAKYPEASMSRGQKNQELKANVLMLKGAYKNDLKARLFFKDLIGEHFHFTAFGIDWLEERWMGGNPPTYQEFADMWQKEYEFRRANGSTPKKEWAYINFVKRYLSTHPKAGYNEILKHWKIERNKHKDLIDEIFKRLGG
jgi:hypothetical protein